MASAKGTRRGGRGKNTVPTVPLHLSTTPQVVAYLEKLAGTGIFGKNPSEVGEQLLRERLRQIFGEVEIVGKPPKPGKGGK